MEFKLESVYFNTPDKYSDEYLSIVMPHVTRQEGGGDYNLPRLFIEVESITELLCIVKEIVKKYEYLESNTGAWAPNRVILDNDSITLVDYYLG